MPKYDRILIQGGTLTAIKNEETGNYAVLLDVPAGADVDVHDFSELSANEANVTVSIVELIETVEEFEDA